MKRRRFLQRMGCLLAVLGLTEAEWLTLGSHYYRALAQPVSRKLALLVGINQYSYSPALGGCLTDVELQRELLINRFGFAAADILTLTEEQASREFIEAAFLDHLSGQAKAGDVVFFHFSGYGTRVKLGTLPETIHNALVPVNEKNAQNNIFGNYILAETLLLLLRSLSTEQVMAVLDTSYHTPSTFQPKGLRTRTRPESPEIRLVAKEVDFLQQLKIEDSGVNKGLVLQATSNPQQLAQELFLSGLSAGLFTYALTQYLWETIPASTIQILLYHAASSMHKLGSKQQPSLLMVDKNAEKVLLVNDFFTNDGGGEGVITEIEEDGKTVRLFLAGLPPQVLENYGLNSQFTFGERETLVLRSRTGLKAKGQIINSESINQPQVGQLVQESVRILPRNVGLTIAIDTKLERIERVDATSAFAALARLSTVATGEQPTDYIFSKVNQDNTRYALFSRLGELIPNTSGEIEEAVKVAVQRLVPKLPNLLAAKLWRLTDNEGSSRLAVKVTLEVVNNISPRVVMQWETLRSRIAGTKTRKITNPQGEAIPTIPVGSRMQYRVQNLSDRPVYFMLLGLNSRSSAIAFYPWQVSQQLGDSETKPLLQNIIIAPGETITLPEIAAVSEWVIPGISLFCEHQTILSTEPFTETLNALGSIDYPIGNRKPIAALSNPLEVAQALLQDLHHASAVVTETTSTATDYILDVNNWASLNFSFQVV
ncbi:caspase family protein [Cronbergia sp. UHCC 0137]|uniref:caspase family protein n=1 Tax=Cronbergia sp. UHCC 0137 TaxID=3110239 RepID=UPI002B21F2D5|nr:caspase family protein [Cronbergia sp. UHCC 0137]MEA5619262.1 caspase family protein [Cronbergia sp. UHCC 0137]